MYVVAWSSCCIHTGGSSRNREPVGFKPKMQTLVLMDSSACVKEARLTSLKTWLWWRALGACLARCACRDGGVVVDEPAQAYFVSGSANVDTKNGLFPREIKATERVLVDRRDVSLPWEPVAINWSSEKKNDTEIWNIQNRRQLVFILARTERQPPETAATVKRQRQIVK